MAHHCKQSSLLLVVFGTSGALTSSTLAFAPSLFQPAQRTAPTTTGGHDIELPDFDELFGRIKQVSPLARKVLEDHSADHANDVVEPLKWKTIESKPRHFLHTIDRVDNYLGMGPPLLRFRATIEGPCIGAKFAEFIMSLEERERWDDQIAEVDELFPIDAGSATEFLGEDKYGDCSQIGVGYCQTKSAFGISPREQLTFCAVQNFADGSAVILGTEMDTEMHDHLLPQLPGTKRPTRAKSHLFCTTLSPSADDPENKFEVEYCLQMCTGGLPTFITTPVMIHTVKRLFNHAKTFYAGGEGSELEIYLAALEEEKAAAASAAENLRQVQEEQKKVEKEELLHMATLSEQPDAVVNPASEELVETVQQQIDTEKSVASVIMVEQSGAERPRAHVVVPEHDGPHMMEDQEHDRLVATHAMVHIIDDKPQSTIRWMLSKTAAKVSGARNLVRRYRDRIANGLVESEVDS
jgi:hypothetical protein